MLMTIYSKISHVCLRAASVLAALGAGILLGLPARASVEIFVVDPASTIITLQGSSAGAALEEQGPGGLSATFRGWLVADAQGPTIQLIQGSSLMANETNSWLPGANHSITASPASYGAKATIGSGFSQVHVLAATRNVAFGITSVPSTISSNQFDASGLTFTIPTLAKSDIDYRASGLLVLSGSRSLAGLSATNGPGNASFSFVPEVQVLTIPVDISVTTSVSSPDDTTLRFTGQIVARRGLNIEFPQILWTPAGTNTSQITLVWANPFKLQTATTLNPPDWSDLATDAPITVSLDGSAGFFRVVNQ